MKKIIVLALFACIAAMNVNAQTEGTESKTEKMLRLTKVADENPADWKAQLEAGHFLLDKENGMANLSQAGKYFERIYHLATDYNKEIPDSVFREAGTMLLTVATNEKNIDKALFYIDEMIHAQKVGVDVPNEYLNTILCPGMLFSMINEDFVKSLSYTMDLRERLTKDNTPGIEYTDAFTALVFEGLMEKYRNMFGDKIMELTFDDQKYYIISMNDWNIEKPLMGWMQEVEGSPTLLYGEDGKVYDDKNVTMEYSFFYDKKEVKPQEGANARLITVTPERRKQLVEAYRHYMKKAKKNFFREKRHN